MQRLEPRWQGLLERVKVERDAKVAAFLASGGDCLTCFDRGPCVDCERGQAERARLAEQARRDWIVETGLPTRFQGCTFGSFPGEPALARDAHAFLRGWDGRRNLILTGRYGSGKTGILASLINAMSSEPTRSVFFATTPRLFDALRAGYDDGSFHRTMRRYQDVGLLILDDLGAEKGSEWVQERLYAIVNHRYEHELPIWTSTNLTPAQLTETIGERVWSRLQEGAAVLVATGPNLRAR